MADIQDADFDAAYKTAESCLLDGDSLIRSVGKYGELHLIPDLEKFCRTLDAGQGAIPKVSFWHRVVSSGPFGTPPHTEATAHELAWWFGHRLWLGVHNFLFGEHCVGNCEKPNDGSGFGFRKDVILSHSARIVELLATEKPFDYYDLRPHLRLERDKGLAEWRRDPLSVTMHADTLPTAEPGNTAKVILNAPTSSQKAIGVAARDDAIAEPRATTGAFGEVWFHLQPNGTPLRTNPNDRTLAAFRAKSCARFGHAVFSISTLEQVRDWLISALEMTWEQVLVCKLTHIVEWLSANPFAKPDRNDPLAVLDWLNAAQSYLETDSPDRNRVHQIGRFCWELAGEIPRIDTPTARTKMVKPPPPEAWGYRLELGDAWQNFKVLRHAITPTDAPKPGANVDQSTGNINITGGPGGAGGDGGAVIIAAGAGGGDVNIIAGNASDTAPLEGASVGVPGEPTGGNKPTPKLTPAVRLAYLSYQAVESQAGKRLEDRDAYDRIKEHGITTDKGELGELAGYELPDFDTWSRYLRNARQIMGEQKYEKRSGRSRGKSVARPDEF